MRVLVAIGSAVVFLALAAPSPPRAPRHPEYTNPIQLALDRAYTFWGNKPCPTITATGAEAPDPSYGMWVTFLATPEQHPAVCPIYINRTLWPTWEADDQNFVNFCKEMVHEVGHFEGFPDEGAQPGTVQYVDSELAHIPICEQRTRLYLGHTWVEVGVRP
jgi:hypothetical protein